MRAPPTTTSKRSAKKPARRPPATDAVQEVMRARREAADAAQEDADSRSALARGGRRKPRNAADTKRRILESAAAEFAAKGFDGARLGSIARASNVQQALIHHYFLDKAGLHAEVLRTGVAAMTEDAWTLLAQMDTPVADRQGKKRRGPSELRALAEAFVELLLRFFTTNGAFFSILRHEARREGDAASKILSENVAPIFDAVVARLDEMRARGEIRRDVETRHFVLSCVAMIAFPFQEELFVTAIWPVDWHKAEHLAERKQHVVEMILATVTP